MLTWLPHLWQHLETIVPPFSRVHTTTRSYMVSASMTSATEKSNCWGSPSRIFYFFLHATVLANAYVRDGRTLIWIDPPPA